MPEGVDLGDPAGRRHSRTYYGRPQLKAAPFNKVLVGTYVFLAGLSGAAALLSTLLDLTRGRASESAVRRGRYVALLAPTVGAACLIGDLHTPQRFYNMLRVFKRTSPMSFGSWLLVTFGVASGATACGQILSVRVQNITLRSITRVVQLISSIAGCGMATYTASLLSATSTPLWAAAPRALAVRFGAASVAAAAAAMSLGQRHSQTDRDLDAVAIAALTAELAATLAAEGQYRKAGVTAASDGGGTAPQLLESGVGILLPLGLHLASLMFTPRRSRLLSPTASIAILAGSFFMRCNALAAGIASASDPEVSLRFAGDASSRRP